MDAATINQYISSYYKANQRHMVWSFWASMLALFIGLITLATGIGLALTNYQPSLAITTTAAGVFTQFIGAGFFYLYNKNLKQLNIFYRELILNQDIFFALGLVAHIPEAERSGVIQGLIGRILSRGDTRQISADLVRALNESKVKSSAT